MTCWASRGRGTGPMPPPESHLPSPSVPPRPPPQADNVGGRRCQGPSAGGGIGDTSGPSTPAHRAHGRAGAEAGGQSRRCRGVPRRGGSLPALGIRNAARSDCDRASTHLAISGGHRDLFCVSAQPEDTRKPSRGAAPEPRVLPPSDPLTWQPPLFWNFREARTSQRPAPPQSQAPCRGGSGLPPRSQGPERTPHCDGDPGGQVAGTQGPGRGLVRASPPLGSGRGRVHGPEAWRPEDSASPATQRTVPFFTGR